METDNIEKEPRYIRCKVIPQYVSSYLSFTVDHSRIILIVPLASSLMILDGRDSFISSDISEKLWGAAFPLILAEVDTIAFLNCRHNRCESGSFVMRMAMLPSSASKFVARLRAPG